MSVGNILDVRGNNTIRNNTENFMLAVLCEKSMAFERHNTVPQQDAES